MRYKRVSILLNVSHLNHVISTMSDAVRQSTDDHTLRYLQLRSDMISTVRRMDHLLNRSLPPPSRPPPRQIPADSRTCGKLLFRLQVLLYFHISLLRIRI
jgi:hypothetical protein